MKTTIARKYANAIFAINLSQTALEIIVSEMNILSKIIPRTRFFDFFTNPIFSLEERIDLCKKLKLSKYTEQCLQLLLVNRRILLLPEFACCLLRKLDERLKRLRVNIVTGCQLTKTQFCDINRVLNRIFTKEINITVNLESTLENGILIHADEFVFFNTLDQYLLNLRDDLCN